MTRIMKIAALGMLAVFTCAAGAQTPAPSSNSSAGIELAPKPASEYDPLLDLPRLPDKKVTLIGGAVTRLDRVIDRLTIQPFGAKHRMEVAFDTRTRFIDNGRLVDARALQLGQRVYLDTMLNGTKVFAKTVWIDNAASTGRVRGQLVSYDSADSTLQVRDEISSAPVRLHAGPSTQILRGDQPVPLAELKSGTLVELTFVPDRSGIGEVRSMSILAMPGSTYSFFGRITFLDLSRHMLAIANDPDRKTYEIQLETLPPGTLRGLRPGSQVGVSAVFDGEHYVARTVEPVREIEPAP